MTILVERQQCLVSAADGLSCAGNIENPKIGINEQLIKGSFSLCIYLACHVVNYRVSQKNVSSVLVA